MWSLPSMGWVLQRACPVAQVFPQVGPQDVWVGVRLAVVTLGAHGAVWRCGEMQGRVPGCPVKVADTNGAGDTFFGAFLSRIAGRGGLENLTADEIQSYVLFANKAASITTSRPGAIPAMPTLQEVQEG